MTLSHRDRCFSIAPVAIAVVALFGTAHTEPESLSEPARRAIDAGIVEQAAQHGLPSLATGIVLGDRLDHVSFVGGKSIKEGEAVDERTLYQIGSITKAFTSTLVAQQGAAGRLRWDDPVRRHLPSWWPFPEPGTEAPPITLRLLANHRSGLPGRPPTLPEEQDDGLVRSFSQFELRQSLERARLERKPDTAFGYSNLGYAALGIVLEEVTQRPYERLLREEIFGPLGMDDSTITVLPRHVDLMAQPYRRDDESGATVRTLPQDLDALAPAGGIWSSVHDLARFLSFHMGALPSTGTPAIDRERLVELRQGQETSPGSSLDYGLGWGSTELEIGSVVFHDGGCDGYTAYIGFAPDDRVASIVLTNIASRVAAQPVRRLGHSLLVAAVKDLRAQTEETAVIESN